MPSPLTRTNRPLFLSLPDRDLVKSAVRTAEGDSRDREREPIIYYTKDGLYASLQKVCLSYKGPVTFASLNSRLDIFLGPASRVMKTDKTKEKSFQPPSRGTHGGQVGVRIDLS